MSEHINCIIQAERHEGGRTVEYVECRISGCYADKGTIKAIYRTLALRGFDHIEANGDMQEPRLIRELDDKEDTSPSFDLP